MSNMRRQKFQGITKSIRAQQFQAELLDEIRYDYQMNALWVKFRFDIVLPTNDLGKVIFNGNDNNAEYKQLKDFITHFENNWSFASDIH
ncbi:MAG TPA: hypothetical protein PL045_03300 [Chitinophagaceae bacterium]|nr:hypothetical protein [Chitinophagaceae bacterium]